MTVTDVCVYIYIYHITVKENFTQGDKLALKEVPHKRGTLCIQCYLSWQKKEITENVASNLP